jgi:Uma2 family endonuclease
MGAIADARIPMRPITVELYERMVDAGILTGEDRVELLNGQLSEMSPQSPEHAQIVRWLTTRLNRGIDPAVACVDSRLPVSLPPLSMPEPDIAIVPVGNYAHAHPAEALLVIEVAVSSRALDLGAKAEIYAAAGVAEYWVVDIPARTVHVHGSPAGGRYGACEQVATGSLPPPVPDAPSIDVRAMFAQLDGA